ncbi:hypothetical protein HOL46_00005, partial [Candidatus Falkowbacteria bacterium]|nr:hypothetical protein [Candidatus Falkowbacteria bacterium]
KERKKREKEKDDDKMKVQLVLMFFVAPVVIIFMIVLLIIQISGNGHILTGDSKIASEYKQKRKEVVELQEKLSEKITKLGVAETEFKATIASNVGTIQSNIRRGQIRSFNDAVRNQESNTKLKIIAKAQAYLEIVTAEKRAVARAGVELQGIRANLDLDLTMLKATDQEEMDDLIKKLDNVITKIKPVAEEYVINDYNRGSSDLKSTWNKYFIQK